MSAAAPRGFRLKNLLALVFGLLAMVLAAILTLLISRHTSHTDQQTVQVRLSSLAEVTSHVLDIGLYERMHDILELASVETLRQYDSNGASQALLEKMRESMPQYRWLGVADPAGQLHVSAGETPGADAAAAPWFQEGRQRLYLGDVYLEAVAPGRRPPRLMDLAVPLYRADGQLAGVLGAHLSWDWARGVESTMLTKARRQAGIEIFVLNARGQVILAPVGKEDTELPPLQQLQNNSHALTWPDGEDYLSGSFRSQGYRDNPGLGWRVVVRQPVDKAFAASKQLQVYIIGTGVALALLFTLLGMALAHFLSRPLAELAQAADRLRSGLAVTHLPPGGIFRETRQLSASFDHLLQDLRTHQGELDELNSSLEAQVSDRTQAIERANTHLMSVLEERGQLMEKLAELANTDSLTNLLNRRAFHERAALEAKRAQRQNSAISLITFDIDHFKQVNDRYGHDTGDDVLRQCASACLQQLREIDLVARFGGEEFVILLPETAQPGAEQVAERLRQLFEGMVLQTAQGALQFTASFGVAAWSPDEEISTALQRADQALYAAKNSGRNRVVGFF
ncbi:MAG TPA: diguanylate cyclase [Moraxellaceae bacterium]